MNHHKHHRINTEEYQRELQGLNNSAQLPLLPRSQMTYPPEAKGRATHYPITHAQPLMKSEPLLKANFKQLKQMFPNTNEHDHVLKWASDIKNNDLQSFYLRHYRNNPSIHTDAMKEKIGHINGMIDISDEMKKVKLSKEDTLESGLQKYEDAEKKWQTGNGSRFVTPSATTKPVIDFGDGWGWFDLGVPSDRDEGNALGHCGNADNSHENDRILSLRKVHNIGGKIYHEPTLTFINNQGWIGEMKGRNNSKPSEKYHSRIAELLKHKDIKGLVSAGYMPENNFHFDDLSPEHKNQIKMTNPEFVDLRSNEWDIDHKTKFAKKAPKIEKYENTIRDTFKAHSLKTDLDSGKITMDNIMDEDLRLVANHPHFERKDFDRLIQNVHKFKRENQLSAYGAIKKSRHLTSDDLHTLLDNNLSSAEILKDHRFIDLSHINKIVNKGPNLAAVFFNNHRLLNLDHIDKIVEKSPLSALYLKDHKEFNSKHIDKVIEKELEAAAGLLKNHRLFNSDHINKIIEKNPWKATQELHNHPLLNERHIDKLVEKLPYAAKYLKDHPYYIQKYGQKIQKSFKQLTNEYERLQKVIFRNGTHYPESTDRVGTPHPELQHLVVHKARNGKHVWSYHPELSRIHDRNLMQLLGGQKIAGRNNLQLPNRLASLQKPTVSAVRSFANDLINNPDRHVMSANTDPTKPKDHSEMRVRHLISALTGSDGYEIKDHPEGFEVYAPRHSKSQKADDIATRWIYNAAKKDLRSERIYPTSPNGGSYGTKFGKSIGPRPSNNLGRRQADARKPATQRPRSSEDAMGKTEVASKLLKAEDEAGMTAYPLKDGYSIHHETSQNGYDIWAIGHSGQRAGTFMICTDETRRGRPFVSWAGLEKPHRGKGIGVVAYKALAAHYGGLDSDRNSTSVDALKAWRRAGGKQLKTKTAFGDPRYTLEGDKKRPPIVWNKDLKKSSDPLAPLIQQAKANLAAVHKVASQEPRSILFGGKNGSGRHGFVSLDPSKPNQWRVTHFVKGQPSGHTEADSFSDAIKKAHSYGYNVSKELSEEDMEKNKMKKSEDFSRVSSVVVATDDKMLMLQRRDNGKWTFPGGHLNDTETHLEGAVRELWEEAGIRANPDEMILLGNKKTFQNKDIYVYLYKINSEVNPSAANDPDKEAQKFAWLPHVLPEDIKENLYIPVGDNSSLSMFSVWLLRQKTNKLKELVESKKLV